MPGILSTQVESILAEVTAGFPHDSCLTCECFLGLVMQLKIDAEPAAQNLLDQYKVPRQEMHACLGCDPCPPGDAYAKYIRSQQSGKIITL